MIGDSSIINSVILVLLSIPISLSLNPTSTLLSITQRFVLMPYYVNVEWVSCHALHLLWEFETNVHWLLLSKHFLFSLSWHFLWHFLRVCAIECMRKVLKSTGTRIHSSLSGAVVLNRYENVRLCPVCFKGSFAFISLLSTVHGTNLNYCV